MFTQFFLENVGCMEQSSVVVLPTEPALCQYKRVATPRLWFRTFLSYLLIDLGGISNGKGIAYCPFRPGDLALLWGGGGVEVLCCTCSELACLCRFQRWFHGALGSDRRSPGQERCKAQLVSRPSLCSHNTQGFEGYPEGEHQSGQLQGPSSCL